MRTRCERCDAMSAAREDAIRERDEARAKSAKLAEVLKIITSRKMSKHVAHPQSVWWREWVMEPLQEALAQFRERIER